MFTPISCPSEFKRGPPELPGLIAAAVWTTPRILRPLGIERASDQWIRRNQIEGVPIVRTYRGFPADDAGMVGARRGQRGDILLGDIIVEVDGQSISNNDDFLSAMERHRVGDTVEITTIRGSSKQRFAVRLTESE